MTRVLSHPNEPFSESLLSSGVMSNYSDTRFFITSAAASKLNTFIESGILNLTDCNTRDLDDIKQHFALSCCNKAFSIYLLADRLSFSNRTLAPLIHSAVLNHIHRLYFKLYHTDIEYGQSLVKILRLDYATPPDDYSVARLGFILHRAVCARVDRALLGADIPGRKHYSIRPLFRASSVVIRQSDYQSCGVISDISQLPVVLALTGNTNGLHSDINAELDLLKDVSEPVSLETSQAVRATLGVVTQLMMGLQEREDRNSGPKPDPVESANGPESLKHLYVVEQFQAEKMGWGKRPLRGPSLKWVDTHRYPIGLARVLGLMYYELARMLSALSMQRFANTLSP